LLQRLPELGVFFVFGWNPRFHAGSTLSARKFPLNIP